MPKDGDDIFSIRDIIDSQLETSDKYRIGRVSDIEAEWRGENLYLTSLLSGPQALAGRVGSPLRSLARSLFRDRFDHAIPISDVERFGPTLRLRRKAAEYPVGQSDRWIADHLLRWIPGSGHR
jgi:hypothetical protein